MSATPLNFNLFTRQTLIRSDMFHGATDVEQGKIRREIGTYLKQTRNADQLVEQMLKDPQDDALIEQFQSTEHLASKEHRNARRHKRRLGILEREGME